MLDPTRIKDYISLVKSYEGENDYILSLKSRFNNSKTARPTPKQIEYIQQNYRKVPVIVNEEISISSYFAKKLQEQHLLVKNPLKINIVKVLSNSSDTLHVMVKFGKDQKTPTMVWLPKKHIIKNKVKNNIESVDYSSYDHRPPMVHQREAIRKLLEYNKSNN